MTARASKNVTSVQARAVYRFMPPTFARAAPPPAHAPFPPLQREARAISAVAQQGVAVFSGRTDLEAGHALDRVVALVLDCLLGNVYDERQRPAVRGRS